MVAVGQELLLDGVQQVVGEDGDEDVPITTMLELMEDGTDAQGGYRAS